MSQSVSRPSLSDPPTNRPHCGVSTDHASTGTGHLSTDDRVHAKVIADLRQSGISFDRLEEAADYLDGNEKALRTGAIVIVNGRVSVVDATEAADAMRQEGLTLVYNTEHAVRSMRLLAANRLDNRVPVQRAVRLGQPRDARFDLFG
jgi:hypothetical protein